eukprot:NODE_21415_length_754_cov_3.690590.p1 GENE.NODE_21415_length_754_cov_3.690590~~NODE_21415_length_754_cov_3.690590.p1  ORF type:complete len:218 (-),score=65.57 NODE_21415_length_754_cov_3.690590:9-662(-)
MDDPVEQAALYRKWKNMVAMRHAQHKEAIAELEEIELELRQNHSTGPDPRWRTPTPGPADGERSVVPEQQASDQPQAQVTAAAAAAMQHDATAEDGCWHDAMVAALATRRPVGSCSDAAAPGGGDKSHGAAALDAIAAPGAAQARSLDVALLPVERDHDTLSCGRSAQQPATDAGSRSPHAQSPVPLMPSQDEAELRDIEKELRGDVARLGPLFGRV